MINLRTLLGDEPDVAEIAEKLLRVMQEFPRDLGPSKLTALIFTAAALIVDGQNPEGDVDWIKVFNTRFPEILGALRAHEAVMAERTTQH